MTAANFVVLRLEQTAGLRFDSQQLEVVPAHRNGPHPLAVPLWTNAGRDKADTGQPRQHGIAVAKIEIVRVRDKRERVITAQRLVERDQLRSALHAR